MRHLSESTIIILATIAAVVATTVAFAAVAIARMTKPSDCDYTVDGLALVPLRREQMHDLVADDGCEVEVASCTPDWHDEFRCWAVVDCGLGPGE